MSSRPVRRPVMLRPKPQSLARFGFAVVIAIPVASPLVRPSVAASDSERLTLLARRSRAGRGSRRGAMACGLMATSVAAKPASCRRTRSVLRSMTSTSHRHRLRRTAALASRSAIEPPAQNSCRSTFRSGRPRRRSPARLSWWRVIRTARQALMAELVSLVSRTVPSGQLLHLAPSPLVSGHRRCAAMC